STRAVDYNPNAWLALVPMANVVPGAPVVGATTSVYGYLTQTGLTGWGPAAGFPATPLTGNAAIFSPNNNIVPQSLYGSRDNVSELPGMRRFDMADRRRHKLRSSLDWQASERLSVQMEGEFNKDDYQHSVYGLLQSQISALHLAGDLVGTLARTHIGVRGGSYANNPFALANAPPLAPGVAAVFFIPAADLPPVTTRTLELRLRAQFALSRASQLNLLAAYQR